MNPLRVLIVDDEPLAREGLAGMVKADPELLVAGVAADGRAAVDLIRAERPDLVFLDVQMPQLDGFSVLAELSPTERPMVVFVTAYEQHAIRAFEVSAVDYLLKPFSDSRFAAAVARAKAALRQGRTASLSQQVEELLQQVRRLEEGDSSGVRPPAAPPAPNAPEYIDRIVLKADGALHFIKTEEVIWIEAQGDFVKVQTAGKTQLVRETLQSMEKKLDAGKFLRIHRSFLVNLEHVKRVETALYGDYSVYMSDDTKLRLSRNYRAKLKALVRQLPAS